MAGGTANGSAHDLIKECGEHGFSLTGIDTVS
jgi:hypothetical protein